MKNEGYTIIKRELYDVINRYGVALALNGISYVTWEFKLDESYDTTDTMYDESKTSYFWGHYTNDPIKAEIDFHQRMCTRLIELWEEQKYERE